MLNQKGDKSFFLWLIAALLALAAAAIGYFRNGEVNVVALVFAALFVVMAFVTRSRGNSPSA
jgi:hypothetical protein